MAGQRGSTGKRSRLRANEGAMTGELTIVRRQLFNRALDAMNKKAYLNALSYIEHGLKIESRNPELLLLAGLCNYALGDLAKAEQYWKNLEDPLAQYYLEQSGAERRDFPGIVRAYNLGLELMKKGKYCRVIQQLEPAIRQGPQLLPALELLAWAYYSGRKYQKCRQILLRIREISVDAPVLGKLGPELMRLVRREQLSYLTAVIIILVGMFGYVNHHLKPKMADNPNPVRTGPVAETPEQPQINDSLLRKTADILAGQGNYLASADIYYALDWKKTPGPEIPPLEQLALSKAAAHYYFLAMKNMKNHANIQADQYFTRSRAYPFRSYVYDDSLYFQAIIKERLGKYLLASQLFKQLLKEQPDSNYSLSAVVRWGKLVTAQAELRPEFVTYLEDYPKYQPLAQSIAKSWKD
jgi:tetratricopeptide (TPR) repeat protein